MNAQINLCINTILLESALIAFTMYKSAYVDLNLKLGINHWITGTRCLNFGISFISTSKLCVRAAQAQSRLYFSNYICDKNKSRLSLLSKFTRFCFLSLSRNTERSD